MLTWTKAKALALDAGERVYWTALLERHGSCISELARQSGQERSNVRRHLRRLGFMGKVVAQAAKVA